MSIDDHRWCFMRSHVLVTPTGRTYLQRLRVIGTPWFGIYLHKLEVPDPGVDLHDHPWPFASLILIGGYDEEIALARRALARRGGFRGALWERRARTIHRIRIDQAHRIVRLHRSPTWTLVFVGRRLRSWGFYQADGYVDHKDYDFAVHRKLREVVL